MEMLPASGCGAGIAVSSRSAHHVVNSVCSHSLRFFEFAAHSDLEEVHEGDRACRRCGYASVSVDAGGEQTIATRLRQADDLLSPEHFDACWDTGRDDHLDAHGPAAVRETTW